MCERREALQEARSGPLLDSKVLVGGSGWAGGLEGLCGLWWVLKHFVSDPSKLVHKLFPECFGRLEQC